MDEEATEAVTIGRDRAVGRIGEPSSERSSALAKVFENEELLDLDEIAGPFHWAQSLGGRSRSRVARVALLG